MSWPHLQRQRLTGIWSATPTPFTAELRLDIGSTKRMVEHHLRLRVKGLFLAGTCGEGPWMPEKEKRLLVQTAASSASGKLVLGVQVTDNSAERVLLNIHNAKADGADVAIVAPPYFMLNATPERLLDFYRHVIRESELPVGIYNLGRFSSVTVPDEVMGNILQEKNVVLSKDSSSLRSHRQLMLAAKRKRPELVILSGDEFDCVRYLRAGYDGLLLGGAILTGKVARKISDAIAAGDMAGAREFELRMVEMLHVVYGGKSLACWLSGLKWTLVRMGIFQTWNSFLHYPLTPACKLGISRILKKHSNDLMPWKADLNKVNGKNGSKRKV